MTSRLLNLKDAAAYCTLGVDTFKRACPVQPVRLRPGARGLRYDKHKLDAWIDTLKEEGAEAPTPRTGEDWLATLNGPGQDRRRKGVCQQG